MNDIRLHRITELTPELMAALAAGGYRAVRDPDVVIYVADSAPVRLGQADLDQASGERRAASEETADGSAAAHTPHDAEPGAGGSP